jgi:metal-responsive CopG/Arc/MetJ family transcriptional regulator
MRPERAPRRTITLDIPQSLVEWLDQQADNLTISRSAFVRLLIANAQKEQI